MNNNICTQSYFTSIFEKNNNYQIEYYKILKSQNNNIFNISTLTRIEKTMKCSQVCFFKMNIVSKNNIVSN